MNPIHQENLNELNAALQAIQTLAAQGHRKEALVLALLAERGQWLQTNPSPFVCVLGLVTVLGVLTDPAEVLTPDTHNERARTLLKVAAQRLPAALEETTTAQNLIKPLIILAERLGEDDIFLGLAALNDAVAMAKRFGGNVQIITHTPAAAVDIAPPPTPVGFTLTDGTTLHFNGSVDRYKKNLAAIRLLRQVQMEERNPKNLTADERLTLAHYSAFGESQLLTRAIERDEEFATLVNEEEQNRIRRAALTAFYTPQEVLHVLWNALAPALRQLSGPLQILEPAFGVGMFVATMPLDIRERSAITAVELDIVSSDIGKWLHPDVQVIGGTGFEDAKLPNDTYDLVITNVPFNGNKVFFPGFKEDYLKRCLHDFFIARAIQLTRPGGIVCVLTSYGTMDKRDARTREWIAERADLITALRMPQGAFEANSGTQCGADLLIFRRR